MTEVVELTATAIQELAYEFHKSNQPIHEWVRGGAYLHNGDFVPEEVLLENGDIIQYSASQMP
ncbi:MAG: hypothetical protein NC548_38325 [Lachnospiraceae bacterium]|nr:hypothetical protein [Lachnospiraceae bacterium]